jgi:hypothetical protein
MCNVERVIREKFAAKRASNDCGAVLATDAAHFTGFQLAYWSLVDKCNLFIFDLGLTQEQRCWCRKRGIALYEPPLVMPKERSCWQFWNKPFYLDRSPFERTIWMDVDCIAVNDITPIFDAIAKQPFLAIEHWIDFVTGYPSDLSLRDVFPTEICLKKWVNAGILGIRKGENRIMPLWQEMVTKAAADREISKLFSYGDEGVLHWVIEKLHALDIIISNRGWNRFESSEANNADDFLKNLNPRPETSVVHFSGVPKHWEKWTIREYLND